MLVEGTVIVRDLKFCYIQQDGSQGEILFCYEMDSWNCRKIKKGSRVMFDRVPNNRRSDEFMASDVRLIKTDRQPLHELFSRWSHRFISLPVLQ
jgi:hypothetical protein